MQSAPETPKAGRLILGGTIFLLAQALPLSIPLIVGSDISTELKTILSGLAILGLPEIGTLVAVAILGKPGFNWLKAQLFSALKRMAPSARVSKRRYNIGLIIFVTLLILGIIKPYVTELLPELLDYRRYYTGAADVLFITNLFILGGDFWDKLRALFSYDTHVFTPRS